MSRYLLALSRLATLPVLFVVTAWCLQKLQPALRGVSTEGSLALITWIKARNGYGFAAGVALWLVGR